MTQPPPTKSLAKNWLTQRNINFCFAIVLQLSAGVYKFSDINNNELLIINLTAVPGWTNFKYQFFAKP